MKKNKLLAAFVGGCLGFLSFPEINWTFLIVIAYVPYFWLLNHCEGVKETVWYAWLYSAVMTLGGFFWIAHTAIEFGGLPWFAAYPILLLYAAVGSINLAVTGGLVAVLRKKLSMQWQALWVTAVFVALEAFFPKLFYWYAGNAIYQVIPFIQIADLGGAILLTTQIFWVNYAVFALFDGFVLPRVQAFKKLPRHFTPREAVATIALGAGIVLFSFVYGQLRLQQVEEHMSQVTQKNIGVVQGNLGNLDRLLAQFGHRETLQKAVEIHSDLTRALQRQQKQPLDLVLWPEGTYPYPFPDKRPEHQALAELTLTINAALVTGGHATQREPEYRYFNSMALVEPGKDNASAIYKKHILLAFGEYMPLSNIFPSLKDLIPAISDFGAGPGPEMMRYRDFKIAAIICYEALDPHYLREYAVQGANIILNSTNDSWYGPWQEQEQHLALAQLRSVETRLVQVRATNTGISAVIMPNGEITHRAERDVPTYFAAQVPLMEMPATVYARYGDWWAWVMVLIVAGMLLYRWHRPAQSEQKPKHSGEAAFRVTSKPRRTR
ncbi:apolipoprotein N-acyltransferase [candidate division KSB1 bacterium]|nr:apolipoprotein N-acyltransferase [candidate division KSB1 bacterium]